MAALILLPRRLWVTLIAIAVSCELVADSYFGVLDSSALVAVVCNLGESLAVAWLCRILDLRRRTASRTYIVARLMIVIGIACGLASLIGASYLWYVNPDRTWLLRWQSWLLGDLVGGLITAPTIVVWFQSSDEDRKRTFSLESVAFLAGLASVSLAFTFVSPNRPISEVVSPYLVLPLFLWAALRLSPRTVSVGQSVVAVAFVLVSVLGSGPFANPANPSPTNALALQIFLLVVSVSSLLLSVVKSEREDQHRNLDEALTRLELALAGSGAAPWDYDFASQRLTFSAIRSAREGNPNVRLPKTRGEFIETLHPDDREATLSYHDHYLQTQPNYPYLTEFRIVRSDATQRWIQARAQLQLDERGRPLRLAGIYLDISERKLLERRVRQRLRFQEIVSQSARRFLATSSDGFDEALQHTLREFADFFAVERVGAIVFGDSTLRPSMHFEADRYPRKTEVLYPLQQPIEELPRSEFAWLSRLTLANEIVSFARVDQIPAHAIAELACFYARETKSLLQVPLGSAESPFGVLYLEATEKPRQWDFETIDRCCLVASLISGVIERRIIERELEFRAMLENDLMELGSRLVKCPAERIDAEIEHALSIVGQRFEVDRCYFSELMDGLTWGRVRFEWHVPSVPSIRQQLQHVPRESFEVLLDSLQKGQILNIFRLSEKNPLPEPLQKVSEGVQGKSAAFVPIVVDGELVSAIGLSTLHEYRYWSVTRLTLLKLVGNIVVSALERQKVSQALDEKRDQLTAASRLANMGEMVAGIAHEIRQPLHAIRNFAAAGVYALNDHEESQLVELRRWNQRIAELVDRSNAIINRYRDFCRPSRTRYVPLQIAEILAEAEQLVRSVLVGASVSLRVHLPEQLPDVIGDRVQLEQVFVNLFTNAVEAMSEVPLENRLIDVAVETDEKRKWLRISVIDQGTGVPNDSLQRAFDPFWTTKQNGTGLGLGICRTIITEHQGSIWLEAWKSEETGAGQETQRRGTNVRIELPFHEEAT